LENKQVWPIELELASYHYDEEDESPAVDKVSLQVEKGSFVAILGHNGSGKSTMAKLMNAIYLPTGGKVLVCGMDTTSDEDLWSIRRHAGMVFQNPDNQIVANVVREDVAFGLENLGVPREEMLPRIDEALEAVRMTEKADAAPHMLSGGQKQRVAIAGILAMQPECIVFDEPTSMLDPRGRSEVLNTILRLNREQNITIILITHNMDEAVLADRVIVMDGGKPVLEGTPTEVFSQVEQMHDLRLDVPQATDLVYHLRKDHGLNLPADILNEDECAQALARLLDDAGIGRNEAW
jgi:energy-coupling factor transport system ATP-binding protein